MWNFPRKKHSDRSACMTDERKFSSGKFKFVIEHERNIRLKNLFCGKIAGFHIKLREQDEISIDYFVPIVLTEVFFRIYISNQKYWALQPHFLNISSKVCCESQSTFSSFPIKISQKAVCFTYPVTEKHIFITMYVCYGCKIRFSYFYCIIDMLFFWLTQIKFWFASWEREKKNP